MPSIDVTYGVTSGGNSSNSSTQITCAVVQQLLYGYNLLPVAGVCTLWCVLRIIRQYYELQMNEMKPSFIHRVFPLSFTKTTHWDGFSIKNTPTNDTVNSNINQNFNLILPSILFRNVTHGQNYLLLDQNLLVCFWRYVSCENVIVQMKIIASCFWGSFEGQ